MTKEEGSSKDSEQPPPQSHKPGRMTFEEELDAIEKAEAPLWKKLDEESDRRELDEFE